MTLIVVTSNNSAPILGRSCIKYIAIGIVSVLVVSCAQPGNLTGGEKDTQAPRILSSEPRNGSVNFSGSRITLEFDEFVEIGKASQELVVTPPFEKTPTFSLHKRTVNLQWEDTLAKNTTYVFNFGDGIVDVNERNPLDSNVFVFSTGPYIDSFEVTGRVVDAFTLKPVKEVLVMLYKKDIDSLPLTSMPRYFGKTNEQGQYKIGYLSPGQYKIFALKSENNGYMFDVPTEQVAFSKDLIQAASPDDTNATPFPDLHLFLHADTLQFIKEKVQLSDRGLRLVFNLPVDTLALIELSGADLSDWLYDWGEERDSLTLWFPERNDYDSLDIEVRYDQYYDTLHFLQPSKFAKKEKSASDVLRPKVKGGKLRYFEPLTFITETPFGWHDLSNALLIQDEDSVQLSSLVTWNTFSFVIDHPWKQGTTYKLFLPDSSMCDRYGLCNDTLILSLKSTSKADYGEVVFKHQLPEEGHPYVWQLLGKEGKKVRQRSIAANEQVALQNVPIGTYEVRLIFDRNGNGEWNPGNYSEGRYPEEVMFYDSPLELRPNWVEEVEWNVER